ncbi:MAG TPA: hypothetical protein VNZ03_26875 [Terriglobales bacterium]|jgi:hypothetical protein|nr:hypothetical protein [Terriglobales bacterium]
MRILAAVLAFVLTSAIVTRAAAQTASAPPDKQALAIAITGPRRVRSGSKATIQIAMTNLSGRAIIFDTAPSAEYVYEAIVRDAHGNMAPDTEHGKEVRRSFEPPFPVYSGPINPLEPGKTWKNELVINDLYDLTRPGKYSVQVLCGGAKSDAITVTVIP